MVFATWHYVELVSGGNWRALQEKGAPRPSPPCSWPSTRLYSHCCHLRFTRLHPAAPGLLCWGFRDSAPGCRGLLPGPQLSHAPTLQASPVLSPTRPGLQPLGWGLFPAFLSPGHSVLSLNLGLLRSAVPVFFKVFFPFLSNPRRCRYSVQLVILMLNFLCSDLGMPPSPVWTLPDHGLQSPRTFCPRDHPFFPSSPQIVLVLLTGG